MFFFHLVVIKIFKMVQLNYEVSFHKALCDIISKVPTLAQWAWGTYLWHKCVDKLSQLDVAIIS